MKIAERVLRRVFAAFRGVKRVCDCNRIDLVPSRGTKILLTRYIGRQDNLVPSEGTKIEYGYLGHRPEGGVSSHRDDAIDGSIIKGRSNRTPTFEGIKKGIKSY